MLLNIGRLFLGFGVGLISYVVIHLKILIFTFRVVNGVILQHFVWLIDHDIQVPVYIAEITPKTFRGGFSFTNQVNNYIIQK